MVKIIQTEVKYTVYIPKGKKMRQMKQKEKSRRTLLMKRISKSLK